MTQIMRDLYHPGNSVIQFGNQALNFEALIQNITQT